MVAREVDAAVDGLAVDPRAEELGERHELGDGSRPRHAISRDHERRARPRQEARGALHRRWLRPGPCRHRGRALARVLDHAAHQVHREREEHRSHRRRQRNLERAPECLRRLLGTADLVGPLRELLRHPHEVRREDRRVHQEARILLARGDEERRLRPRGAVEDREAVGEAGRDVDVDDADRPRRLRVAVGRGDRRRLLEPEHVLEPGVGEGVEEGQLGRARIAEEVADAGGAEDLHQHGGDVHAPEDTRRTTSGALLNSVAGSASTART